jgi:AcrR family transcriptional regulator
VASSPLSRPTPRERSDAARNRSRILEVAEALFAEHGVENVSMDQIAEGAGVGKGTLYRGFGDRAGLAIALLDDRERQLQEAFLFGPPPLGPGAEPVDRIVAFLRALAETVSRQGDILVCAETACSGARFRSAVYVAHRSHLAILIAQACPEIDAGLMAEVLMAPLAAELVRHLDADAGHRAEHLADLLERLARGGLQTS